MHQYLPDDEGLPIGDPVEDGREWVWPDGTRAPIIRGGSDPGPAPAPAAAEPSGGAEPAPAPAPAGGGAPPPQFAPEAQQLIDQLRGEAEGYRKKWGPIAQNFDGIHPDDMSALGGLAKALREDPSQAVEWMVTNAKTLAGEGWQERIMREMGEAAQAQQKPQFDASNPDQLRELMRAEMRSVLEQRSTEDRATQEAQRIRSDLEKAGVAENTPEWREVLYHMRENGATVEEAVEHVRGYFETEGQRYARLKADQARRNPTPPPQGSPAPGSPGEQAGPKNPEAAARARLDAIFGKT